MIRKFEGIKPECCEKMVHSLSLKDYKDGNVSRFLLRELRG